MKKMLFVCLMAVLCIQAQSQTTWDEYNYCTKGYKDVLEKGLSAKAGYKVTDVTEQKLSWQNGKEYATAWLKSLKKTANNKTVAYILIYQLRDKTDNKQYMCIPHPDSSSDILNSYLTSLSEAIDEKTYEKLLTLVYMLSFQLKW